MGRKYGILYRVMKMYRYTEKDRAIIAAARKENKNKRAEKRLHALELRASGKSSDEVAKAVGFHPAYISQLTAKYQKGGIEAISGNHYGGNRKNMTREEAGRQWVLNCFIGDCGITHLPRVQDEVGVEDPLDRACRCWTVCRIRAV